MRIFDATTRRLAIKIGLPALLIFGAMCATVLVSLWHMAGDVNRVESTMTHKSVTAAVHAMLRRMSETNDDYARWDDAVQNLYGEVNTQWTIDNVVSSTIDPVLFDTFYLLDERGNALAAYRNGEPVSVTPADAFGPSLPAMLDRVFKDGKNYSVATGIVKGEWGLAAVAIGPIVPLTANYKNPPQPQHVRFLLLSKAFDEAAVRRMSEDFLIDGLHLASPDHPETRKLDITDPNGTVVGALAWSPMRLGSLAHARVNPAVLSMLGLVGLTVAFLIVYSVRGWKEVQTRELHLNAALNNMGQGLCMFDANERLAISNPRFAEIYAMPPEQVVPGMTVGDLMALAFAPGKASDTDPDSTQALQEEILSGKTGLGIQHLSDGRSIEITHRPTPDGGFVATFEDITERRQAEERVRYLAHHDALTGLLNRVAFYEQMETVLGRIRRGDTVGVLSLDLDHFKSVNDTLGHPIGDQLLQAVAERMCNSVRRGDIVARLGGDEFAVVQVPPTQSSDIAEVAARLIEVVGEPYDLDGHQVVVGASVGIALASNDSTVPDILMKDADLALYRCKADGGNTYRFFEYEMDARMQARRILELDLRRAIVNGEFQLVFQPIVDVKSGRITSCEALVRWNHPDRGLVAPDEFIPVAEETGIIVPLGEWVLRGACAEAARWPKNVSIAVNLSPAQFKSRNLVASVINALATSGLEGRRLNLEITESVLLQGNESAFAVLHQLRELGIKIVMDDFGTGYSSLGYLRSFPFDKIKIDQSFIRDLPEEEDSIAIVRAVVGLSSSLGITTTAEGVETPEQLASISTEGCDEYQGFLMSEPRPAAEIERLIGGQSPQAEAEAVA